MSPSVVASSRRLQAGGTRGVHPALPCALSSPIFFPNFYDVLSFNRISPLGSQHQKRFRSHQIHSSLPKVGTAGFYSTGGVLGHHSQHPAPIPLQGPTSQLWLFHGSSHWRGDVRGGQTRGAGGKGSARCVSLSPPGPIPLIYLHIKGLFSFPSTAGARQTERSLSSYFSLGAGPGGHLRPKSPACLRNPSGISPRMGFPELPAPGFVPKPRAWQIRNGSLSCCRPRASSAKVSSPTPNTLTSTILSWIRVWRHCLGSGLQLCLTLECRRKGPYGPANLAAIKDIHYAIMNRLRRARHWVTGAAPQPVLKDRDVYCPGHWPLHRPAPNPASLTAD